MGCRELPWSRTYRVKHDTKGFCIGIWIQTTSLSLYATLKDTLWQGHAGVRGEAGPTGTEAETGPRLEGRGRGGRGRGYVQGGAGDGDGEGGTCSGMRETVTVVHADRAG